MRIEHVALWTSELERARDFYTTHLGAQAGALYHNPHTGFRSYFLRFALGSEAAVDGLTEQLRRAGVTLLSAPRHTGDGYYESVVLDPDGNRLELTV